MNYAVEKHGVPVGPRVISSLSLSVLGYIIE